MTQYQHVVYGVTPGGLPTSGGPAARAYAGPPQRPIHVRSERLDVDDDADDQIGEDPSGLDECPLCGSDIDADDDNGE
ncbi:hypothetical protein VT930_11775 [Mycobacterium sherrisii]|uniref:hypothetical protein n=1 Tax=Mycobacterium sherrisii TaxID=243061 RepID=UPI002DDD0B10|nr:hypothetical protein [Mycobacterium sherrisii]MEC4763782.1 hypothetical protein [Mycobacterium sherrisii]